MVRVPRPGSRFIATPRSRGQKTRFQRVVLFGTVYSCVTLCVLCLFVFFPFKVIYCHRCTAGRPGSLCDVRFADKCNDFVSDNTGRREKERGGGGDSSMTAHNNRTRRKGREMIMTSSDRISDGGKSD